MTWRQSLAARVFRAWDRTQRHPVGRAIRAVRGALDPLVYAAWYVVSRYRTRRPVTFDDKLLYKMVHDRRPILTEISDKIAVRDHVARTVGERYLTRLYQVHDAADEIRWETLPREFVCKVSHASGGAILVTEAAGVGHALPRFTPRGHGRLLAHPDAFDRARAGEILDTWLAWPYGWSGWKREWAYRNIRPRLLVEEFLEGPDGAVPADFKFYMFHGKVGFIQLDRDRFGTLARDLYDETWTYLPVGKTIPRSGVASPRPQQLDEMLDVAKRLAAPFDFIRVDLYALEDRVVFGELTSYPAGGDGAFHPREYGKVIGDLWTVPQRYA